MYSLVHENFRNILWNNKRRRRFRVSIELCKHRRILAEVFFQCIDPCLVAGVIGQELRDLSHLGIVKILEQPYESPRVVSGAGTYVGASDVSARFHIAGIAERMEFAQKKYRQQVGAGRTQNNGSSDFPLLQLLVLLHQGDCVAVDGVGDLVTKCPRELFAILYEVQERIDYIHVSAGSRERIRLSFMNQVELERMVISGLRRSRDRVGKWFQLVIQR